jgi:hypothetical protein
MRTRRRSVETVSCAASRPAAASSLGANTPGPYPSQPFDSHATALDNASTLRRDQLNSRAKIEAKKRTLLRELERALLDALSGSAELHRSVWELQRAGFALRFSIECREREESSAGELPSRTPAASAREASFRIDAGDLRFLHSIGIDPTRRPRSRSRSRK